MGLAIWLATGELLPVGLGQCICGCSVLLFDGELLDEMYGRTYRQAILGTRGPWMLPVAYAGQHGSTKCVSEMSTKTERWTSHSSRFHFPRGEGARPKI
jgi:hypothetical protein